MVWKLCVYDEKHSTLMKKYTVKLSQRIALVYLPPKLASWRYERGSRSLVDNLAPKKDMIEENKQEITKDDENEEQDDYKEGDVPEEIDQVVDILLDGLGDSNTSVRWSSAKGLGRIAQRLPYDFANEIVFAVLELFSPIESDSTWNGACLAIAELSRNGLILPKKIKHVIPSIVKSLSYDYKKGNRNVGLHVRDSACYVFWALSRAYNAGVMSSFSHFIACSLINTALFDREISCRRFYFQF